MFLICYFTVALVCNAILFLDIILLLIFRYKNVRSITIPPGKLPPRHFSTMKYPLENDPADFYSPKIASNISSLESYPTDNCLPWNSSQEVAPPRFLPPSCTIALEYIKYKYVISKWNVPWNIFHPFLLLYTLKTENRCFPEVFWGIEMEHWLKTG